MSAKTARQSESSDPTPEIPAVDSQPTMGEEALHGEYDPSVGGASHDQAPAAATPPPVSSGTGTPGVRQRLAPVPPRITPMHKDLRVIRVRTADGVNVIINAHDYDPEMHTPLTPDDKKWGEMSVKARDAAADQREQEAYIKRLVRGRGL